MSLTIVNSVHWAATGVFLFLVLYCLQYRRLHLANVMAAFFFLAGLWTLMAALINLAPSLPEKIFLNRLKLVSPVLLPLAIFAMAQAIHGRLKVSRWLWLILTVIPIGFLFVLASPYHHHFIGDYGLRQFADGHILSFRNGDWFWIHNSYARLLTLTSLVLIVRATLSFPSAHKLRFGLVVFALLAPFIIDSLAVFFVPEMRYLQITPIALTMTGVVLAYAVLKERVLDLIPIGRSLLAEQLPDGYLMFDSRLQLVDFNPAAQRLLALPKRAIGRPVVDVLRQFPVVADLISSRAIDHDSKPSHSRDLEISTEDSVRSHNVSIRTLFNALDEEVGGMVLFHDVTEARAVERELRAINEMKTRLLGILAHDLTSNVQGISLLSEALLRADAGSKPADLRPIAEMIKASSENMNGFIADLLIWSKSQLGLPQIQAVPVSVKAIAEEAMDFLSPVARARGITLCSDVPPSLVIRVDRHMIATVLRNLIANAIKYSPPNGTVRATSQELPHAIEIHITDNGEASISGDLRRRFAMDDANRDVLKTSASVGHGMGLVLSQEFVKLHGGRIWVDRSDAEKRTTFHVLIPRSGPSLPSLANDDLRPVQN